MAEAAALDDSGGNGEDVLHRAPQRNAGDVVGPVGSEGACRQGTGQVAPQAGIGRGDADGRRQALHGLLGETRARQHGQGPPGQDFGQHLRHQQAARGLDALGADDDRAAARQLRRQGAHGLGGTDQEDGVAGAETCEIGRRLDAGVQRQVRQIDGIGALPGDRRRDRGIARPHRHPPAGAAAEAGQRRPPGSAADHADVVNRRHRLRFIAMEMRSTLPR